MATKKKEAVPQIVDNVEALEAKMKAMREAQKIFATYTQEQVDAIFLAAATAAMTAAARFLVMTVVMVTVDAGGFQLAVQIGLDCCVCFTRCTGADFDAGAGQCGLGATANAAAQQDAHRKIS